MAFGVFYSLFQKFDWTFPIVPENYVGPIIVLFMILVFSITLYALILWAPKSADKNTSTVQAPAEGLKDYFLIGCGIGNRLSILPIQKEVGHNSDFLEFVDLLKRSGIRIEHVESVRSFEKKLTQSVANGDVKSVVIEYMEYMNNLPDLIREQCSEEQYRMLFFGKLIHEIPTLMHLNATNKDLDSLTLSLESLLPKLKFSNTLECEIMKFVDMVKRNGKSGEIMEFANKLSKIVCTVA